MPEPTNKAGGVCVLLFLAAGLVLAICTDLPKSPAEKEQAKAYRADDAAQTYIAEHLKSPRSAHFGKSRIQLMRDGHYVVSSWVDSQNSFGAELRTHYTCAVSDPDKSPSVDCQTY